MESAHGQLPGCSCWELAEFALLVALLRREHGLEPSKVLLDDLAAALVSLLPREPWPHKRSALALVLNVLSEGGWPLSVALHDQAANELLRAAAGAATAQRSRSTGPAFRLFWLCVTGWEGGRLDASISAAGHVRCIHQRS